MKKIFLGIWILLSFHNSIYAKDYKFYYRQTALAEECLRNGHFELSLMHFDSAFNDQKYKFPKDGYIAAQIAAYLKDDKKTFTYLEYAMRAGVSFDCLSQNKIFQTFWHSEQGASFIKNIKTNWSYYLSTINTNLCKEWTSRLAKEQKFKSQPNPNQYYQQIRENLDAISTLLHIGIFPNCRLIGVDNSIPMAHIGSGLFPNDTCRYNSERAIGTLLHFTHSYDYFKSQLHTAMLNGYIHPYEVLFIYVFNKNNISKAEPKDIDGFYDFKPDTGQILHFNTIGEKHNNDSTVILKNRFDWYIPRPGKYNADELRKLYGVDIEVGDFIF